MTKKPDDEKAKNMQQKYLELQVFDQKLKQLQQQLHAVETQMIEIQTILLALDDIAKAEVNKEVLVPLSSGIFVKAELKDNKMLKVNVGSNTIVEKSVPDTKALLDRQIMELTKLAEDLNAQYVDTMGKAENIQKELQSLVSAK